MRLHTRKIAKAYAISLTGAGTTILEIPAYDLSHAISMTAELKITSAAADATDKLDVRGQDTNDRVTWNDRFHMAQVLGSKSASASAPAVYRINLMAEMTTLNSTGTESSYEETGSSGGSALAANSTRNGPLLGPFRGATGWLPSFRVLFVVTSGNAAAFAGQFDLMVSAFDA